MTLSPTLRRIGPALLLLAIVAIVVGACLPGSTPTGSDGLPISPTPHPPLTPAQPTDLFNLFAWLFTPIFQVSFIILIAVYQFLENLGVPGAILWAIVVLTLVVRALLIPLYRRQLISQRRMQLIQPELREIQKRYKGDTVKARLAQQEMFRERGINPLAGCLPLLLQLPLLFIIYSVIQNGLTNQDPTAMLTVFGVQVVDIECKNIVDGVIDATRPVHRLGRAHPGRREQGPDPVRHRGHRHQRPGHRLVAAPARPVPDDAAGRRTPRTPTRTPASSARRCSSCRSSRSSTAACCRPACSSTGSSRPSSRSSSST